MRAASFICTHGFYSAVLSTFWSWPRKQQQKHGLSWSFIVLATAVARTLGLVGSIGVFSWTLGDNIYLLILSGIENLFEQVFSTLGLPFLQFPLPRGLLAGTFFCLGILSSSLYVSLIYIMHSSVLYKMGHTVPVPRFLEQKLKQSQANTF